MTRRSEGLWNRLVGKGKRIFGELTARPDIVLEGEEQQTEGMQQERAATAEPKRTSDEATPTATRQSSKQTPPR